MKITIKITMMFGLLLSFCQSDARLRYLSLDMDPAVFQAHWWLNFDENAFKTKWLAKEVTCHFDENNDECHNLAALLRMYAELAPKKVVEFGLEIMPLLEYDESHQLEVALFLFLYADDRRYIHILDEHDVEYYDEPVEAEPWLLVDVVKNLKSENSQTVETAIKELLQWQTNKGMDQQLLVPMILLAEDESRFGPFLFANLYLLRMGYLGYFDEMAYEFDDIETVTVISHVIDLSEYLANKPISKTWKHYAKTISSERLNHRNYHNSELVNFFESLSASDDPQLKEKIAYIKQLAVYKNSSLSMKYQIGDRMMYKHKKEGSQILQQVFKTAGPAMKSALVVQYPELFPIKADFWQKMKTEATDTERILVLRNEKHIADRIRQAEINRKAAAKRAEREKLQ